MGDQKWATVFLIIFIRHGVIAKNECKKDKMPCYRKDDRAMRPIAYMGGLKIFGSPWIAMPI